MKGDSSASTEIGSDTDSWQIGNTKLRELS